MTRQYDVNIILSLYLHGTEIFFLFDGMVNSLTGQSCLDTSRGKRVKRWPTKIDFFEKVTSRWSSPYRTNKILLRIDYVRKKNMSHVLVIKIRLSRFHIGLSILPRRQPRVILCYNITGRVQTEKEWLNRNL